LISLSPGSKISIVMPVLDEADGIGARLADLAPLRARGAEIIVVDGGSKDGTPTRAAPQADLVLYSARGRAAQMNAGARAASGDILLFLHADTMLPHNALSLVRAGLADCAHVWGRFDVRILGVHPLLPVVAGLMNFRSRKTGIATGDQAIFVRSDIFAGIGGFPDIALMEDVALSAALKRISRPVCISSRATTSGRRWDRNGFWRTVLLMWRLRAAYFFGAAPDDLARRYGYRPRET
jgi:rSAM/selenodomain-associated transferase 2